VKNWRIWLGFAISLAFLAFAFRGQDLGEVRRALRQTDYRLLVPALALYFTGVWIRAIRWSVLLRPIVRLSARQVFPVVVVGYTANNILPLRTGEVVRAYLLGRQTGVKKTSSLATIAVERLFDGLTMLSFMLLAATVVSFTSELRHLTLVAFILFVGMLIGLFVLTLGGSLRDRLMQLVLGPMPTPVADRVERVAESFLSGLGVLRRASDLGIVAGTSVVAWLCEAGMYWVIARALGTDLASVLGVGETLLTTGVANLATLVPSSPGYVGPFEAGVILVVNGALGVQREVALTYAILVHAALFFPITIIGLVIGSRMHLSLKSLRSFEEPTATDDGPLPTEPVSRPTGGPATVASSGDHGD